MYLRRLNNAGLNRMNEFLDSLGDGQPEERPESFLIDAATSEALPVNIQIERRSFARKYEASAYLLERLGDSGLRNVERDKGLWAWLAMYWFELLCPPDKDGRCRPRERARWIPQIDDARRYYRHLLLGPYLIYASHCDAPDRALAFLCQPIQLLNHLFFQLASRQQLITAKSVVGAATRLYYDKDHDRLRRGTQTYGKAGSVFRFADVLMQLDRTYDLHSLTVDTLIELLPQEFAEFHQGANSRSLPDERA